MKQCLKLHIGGFDIILRQLGIDRFTVQYGKQKTGPFRYADAAKELGQCIMHGLSCEGRVDNREAGDA